MVSDEAFSGDSDVAALCIPPHSVEAEQSVLGALLIDNGAWDRIAEQITERDFFRRNTALFLPPSISWRRRMIPLMS